MHPFSERCFWPGHGGKCIYNQLLAISSQAAGHIYSITCCLAWFLQYKGLGRDSVLCTLVPFLCGRRRPVLGSLLLFYSRPALKHLAANAELVAGEQQCFPPRGWRRGLAPAFLLSGPLLWQMQHMQRSLWATFLKSAQFLSSPLPCRKCMDTWLGSVLVYFR